jgi:predicted ArsR family transcriptional regulator
MVNEDGQFYVVFDQCYCPMVSENTKGASRTLCYCTLGNLRHKFSIGLKQKAKIEMLSSILAGGEECRFHVKLQNV